MCVYVWGKSHFGEEKTRGEKREKNGKKQTRTYNI